MGVGSSLKSPTGWTAWDYANHICALLQAIVENTTDDDAGTDRRIHRPFVITLDASGNGQEYVKLQPGVTANLLTYGFQVNTSGGMVPGGYIGFYRDEEQGTSLLLVDDLANIRSDNFNADGHYIPAQSTLLVVVRGGPVGAIVSGNIGAVQSVSGPGHPTMAGMS